MPPTTVSDLSCPKEQDGRERVIAYTSAALTAAQTRYCVTRKELLGRGAIHPTIPTLPAREEVPLADRPWEPGVAVPFQDPQRDSWLAGWKN